MADKPEKSQIWQTVLAASAGAVFTLLGVAVNAGVTYLGKDRELDVKMVEISLSILRGETEGTKGEMARRFALRSLQQYSRVAIPESEFNTWVTSGTVPFKTTAAEQYFNSNGNLGKPSGCVTEQSMLDYGTLGCASLAPEVKLLDLKSLPTLEDYLQSLRSSPEVQRLVDDQVAKAIAEQVQLNGLELPDSGTEDTLVGPAN